MAGAILQGRKTLMRSIPPAIQTQRPPALPLRHCWLTGSRLSRLGKRCRSTGPRGRVVTKQAVFAGRPSDQHLPLRRYFTTGPITKGSWTKSGGVGYTASRLNLLMSFSRMKFLGGWITRYVSKDRDIKIQPTWRARAVAASEPSLQGLG